MTPSQESPDEDDQFDADGLDAAANQPLGEPGAPEVPAGTEELTAWDEVPGISGSAAPKVMPEDEVPPAEQLVAEGLEEAEREQRIAAADLEP